MDKKTNVKFVNRDLDGNLVTNQMLSEIIFWETFCKDLSRVKTDFKSVPLQFYFEIAGLASAKKWHKIQNMAGEECF